MFLTGDVASAYSFSAKFGIAPIRGKTLSSLLFVTVLPKQSLQSTSNEHLYCVLCSEVLSYCCAKVLIVPAEGKMSDSDREPRLEFNVSPASCFSCIWRAASPHSGKLLLLTLASCFS